ncbi:MAG: 23S rRNA (guanosine(2251)-2'-O)-methyltransferase RlmB [Candidatus Syntrophonatronum acetioxidans]|uniref:23S rRNA (Guanosine(2251)-2'-O)-methyltransferase RlmB n=1 Tax=Candidatus Syntrophonatronum acetioxidans TaxID=1795816 RepID=A0A424Y9D0_9FIRM|nr:MAG: 23S rRNA (guanosine(2251)-2'-O)-methyltransferase RlmB [Candidatus Syntrophonatronum acetioxidans]
MDKSQSIFGRQPVLEALRAGALLKKILVAQGTGGSLIKEIEKLSARRGIALERIDRNQMDSLASGFKHQGVAALGFEYKYAEIDDIISLAQKRGEHPFILVLDQIQDPQNLGALIRTAEGAGVHGAVIPFRRSAQVTPAVFKASAGAIYYLPLARANNLNRLVEELKDRGLWVFGTEAEGDFDYYEGDYRGPAALVMGSEGKGISRLLKEKCDYLVRIPMKGKVTSLNASAAGAVLMYEVLRQRCK